MTGSPSFLDEPDGTGEEIMKATYVALCEHGYAELTIQRIGDEFPKSKSLLYHHYDSKDELLLEFLEFMLDQLEGRLPLQDVGGADDHVEKIVDRAFDPAGGPGDDFSRALVELRAQAAHDERYREYFTRSDQFVRNHVAYVIRSGISQGVFQDVDPRETAALFQVVFVGTMTQWATSDEDDVLDDSRAAFERYVRACLLSEE